MVVTLPSTRASKQVSKGVGRAKRTGIIKLGDKAGHVGDGQLQVVGQREQLRRADQRRAAHLAARGQRAEEAPGLRLQRMDGVVTGFSHSVRRCDRG